MIRHCNKKVPKIDTLHVIYSRGIPKAESLRRRFGDFAAEGKVTRRRHNQLSARYCFTAALAARIIIYIMHPTYTHIPRRY